MVSFDIAATLSLVLVLTLLIYYNRKKLTFHRFGIFYAALYRTKTGLASMENLAKKYKHFWETLAPWIIGLGFIGMALVTFDLARSLITVLAGTSSPTVGLVLPFKAKGVFYVPFFYWIISIFVILVVHEGMHGVIARVYGLKLKNSGLVVIGAILPLIPGAFVEPDEKKLVNSSRKKQFAVYAAGPAANIFTGLIFMLLLFFVINPIADTFYSNDGVVVTDLMSGNPPAEKVGIVVGEKITYVNGQPIQDTSDFSDSLSYAAPGDIVNVVTSHAVYDIKLGTNPENKKAWLGVYVDKAIKGPSWAANTLLWIKDLVFWLFVLSIGVGLFNLVPLGPIDGGRMFLTLLQSITHEKRADVIWKSVSFMLLGILITNVLMAFI